MLSVKSCIVQSGLGPDSFCDGIGFSHCTVAFPNERCGTVWTGLPLLKHILWHTRKKFATTHSIHHRSASKTMLSLRSCIVQSGFCCDSRCDGFGVSQLSSSRFPVNDDVFQFITAARRKQCYQQKALSYNLVSGVIRVVTV